ncbi:hypothetical protein CHU98_g4084 [Xylaria longipes]|nr:hypothetical protein CHU98_g4084 [Xylaria longipes]
MVYSSAQQMIQPRIIESIPFYHQLPVWYYSRPEPMQFNPQAQIVESFQHSGNTKPNFRCDYYPGIKKCWQRQAAPPPPTSTPQRLQSGYRSTWPTRRLVQDLEKIQASESKPDPIDWW